MLKIEVATNSEVKEWLYKDATVANQALTDEELIDYNKGTWKPGFTWNYLKAVEDDKIIAVWPYTELTSIAFIVHLWLSSSLQGEKKAENIALMFEKWLKENKKAQILLAQIPHKCCPNVVKLALKLGYKKQTIISDSCCLFGHSSADCRYHHEG